MVPSEQLGYLSKRKGCRNDDTGEAPILGLDDQILTVLQERYCEFIKLNNEDWLLDLCV